MFAYYVWILLIVILSGCSTKPGTPGDTAPENSSGAGDTNQDLLTPYANSGITQDTVYNICDRTLQVQQAILEVIESSDCSHVLQKQLDTITEIDLENKQIMSLQPHDFFNLYFLKELELGNNVIPVIHPNQFAHNTSLQWLSISHNNLKTIPLEALSPLTVLTNVYLFSNAFTREEEERIKTHIQTVAPGLDSIII